MCSTTNLNQKQCSAHFALSLLLQDGPEQLDHSVVLVFLDPSDLLDCLDPPAVPEVLDSRVRLE